MKKFTIGLFTASSVLISSQAFAQLLPCYTDQMVAKSLQDNTHLYQEIQALEEFTQSYTEQSGESMPPVYTIPVVFHIIHDYGAENISDAQILDAMSILNIDFRKLNADTASIVPAFQSLCSDAEIEFKLAKTDPWGNCTTGITRTASQETYIGDDGSKLGPWPRNKYLNIWVVKNIGSGAAAYAYLPGTAPSSGVDGIICRYDYVGSIGTSSVSKSRTLTHEIGHFLNLRHVWGNTNQPGVACGDDLVNDTPETMGWTSCNLTNNDVCNVGIEENVQNYMDYSYCSKMFTSGQVTRMRAALNSSTASRNNLWTSGNLTATGVNLSPAPLCAPVADFDASVTTFCVGTSVTFTDMSWAGQTASWSWSFPGGTPSSSTAQNPTVTYSTPGVYTVSLTSTNTTGSNTKTKTNYITVFSTTAMYSSWQFYDGFDIGGTIPNADWTVYNPDNNNTWIRATNGVYFSPGYCIMITNVSSMNGQIDEVMGPTFNLSQINSPYLHYRVAFAQKNSANADRLRVFVSTNCGQTWILKGAKVGSQLATVNPQTATFVPTSVPQWRKDSISLSAQATSTNVRIKFEFQSDAGNNIYLDDINVSGPLGGTEIEQDQYSLLAYPNPSSDASTISFSLPENKNLQLGVYDMLGRNVLEVFTGELDAGTYEFSINSSNLEPGIYFIRLVVDGNITTRKIIVN